MSDVTIYTTLLCPYCYRAKDLLKKKGASYSEVDVGMDPDKRREMMARAGGRHTVPQIFAGDVHIGGCDDLYALEREGKLDALVGVQAS